DAERRNVVSEPGQMLGADGVMVRESAAVVHEGLLRRALHVQILLDFAFALLLESEGEVEARATAVRMTHVAACKCRHAAIGDGGTNAGNRGAVERNDIAPDGGGLAHIRRDAAVK